MRVIHMYLDVQVCLVSWLWRWYHGCTHIFKLIKLYMLNVCNCFVYQLYLKAKKGVVHIYIKLKMQILIVT